MRHRVTTSKLSRPTGQRWALFRGQVRSLVLHGRITTTKAKAKATKPIAERLITLGRRAHQVLEAGNTLENRAKASHYRRLASALVPDDQVIRKVFDELAPRYKDRPGGYVRLLKAGYRPGDAAPKAMLELVS
ncbi:MAG: 50S ribosomal protein L17 [Chloroflexi bacterium]|nr:50S ribosomal protein L17 [Chloroflexota bacterium]